MLSFARVRALGIITLLTIGALVTVVMAISRDGGEAVAGDGECSDDDVIADLALPEAHEIEINVYNATERIGLAGQLSEDFTNRDFQVAETGDDPLESEVEGVAELRYGPDAVGAAHVLQAYFLNNAVEVFDIEREGEEVDVVVGARFRQLATETEVKQSIAALGPAVPPSGTCARSSE